MKVFTISGHVDHLGHLTWTTYINFRPSFPCRLKIKVDFDSPCGFGEDFF